MGCLKEVVGVKGCLGGRWRQRFSEGGGWSQGMSRRLLEARVA